MSDTGAFGGLILPPRKALQMSLIKVPSDAGKRYIRRHCKATNNTGFTLVMMNPALEIQGKFEAPDGSEVLRRKIVHAWCNEADLDKTVDGHIARENVLHHSVLSNKCETNGGVLSLPISPTSRDVIGQMPLQEISPIQHRSSKHPDESAIIGINLLHNLGMYIDCSGEVAVLEIEKDVEEWVE